MNLTNLTGQTITNTVTEYDTATGAVLYTYNAVNVDDQQVVGVYKPNDDSNMHVVFTSYISNGVYMVPSESKVDTINTSTSTIKESNTLSKTVDYVCNHYAEDNEFTCLSLESGYLVRCFGK
jgi:hypothetical protein